MSPRIGLGFLMILILAVSYLVRAAAAMLTVGGAPFEIGITLLVMAALHNLVSKWAKL